MMIEEREKDKIIHKEYVDLKICIRNKNKNSIFHLLVILY